MSNAVSNAAKRQRKCGEKNEPFGKIPVIRMWTKGYSGEEIKRIDGK